MPRIQKGRTQVWRTALWLVAGSCRKVLILGGFVQCLLSLFDVAFLILFTKSMTQFQIEKSLKFSVSVFGIVQVSFRTLFILLFLLIFIKNVASSLVQRMMLSSLAKQESLVASYFVGASLFEKLDKRKSTGTSELSQFSLQIVNQVYTQMFRSIVACISELVTVLFIIVATLFLNLYVAIFFILFFGISSLITLRLIAHRQKKYGLVVLDSNNEVIRRLGDFQRLRQDILLGHKEEKFLDLIWKAKSSATHASALSAWLGLIPRYVIETLFIFVMFLTTDVLLANDNSSKLMGIYALLVGVGFRVLPSLNTILTASGLLNSMSPALQRIDDLAERFNIRNRAIPRHFTWCEDNKLKFEGDLLLRDVTYIYPNSNYPIFEHLNLVLKPKTTTWVEGRSGAGKTTLLGLVTGLIEPTRGGVFMRQGDSLMPINSQVQGMTYLNQDVPLLDESISFNIALGPTTLQEDQVIDQLLIEVGLEKMMERNSFTLKSEIGENGEILSAGERQRLGIIRALYAKSELLIFDEPTSNLDDHNEALFWQVLERLRGRTTILLVSHRKLPADAWDQRISLDER